MKRSVLLLFRLIVMMLAMSALAPAAGSECKTPKGQSCMCAASNGKKCAHSAKAVCLSGQMVETPPGARLTVHESNMDLFKQCRELGGMKEIVFNNPLVDSLGVTRETASEAPPTEE